MVLKTLSGTEYFLVYLKESEEGKKYAEAQERRGCREGLVLLALLVNARRFCEKNGENILVIFQGKESLKT